MEIRKQRIINDDNGLEILDSRAFGIIEEIGSSELEECCPVEQIRIAGSDDSVDMYHVQAFVSNNSFPQTVNELLWFINEFNVETILNEQDVEWTVPKWAKIGDIVFFMHTKTAKTTITRLRSEIQKNKDAYSEEEYELLMEGINRGLDLYHQYGGKIYAIGRVAGGPEKYVSIGEEVHWNSKTYANIDHVTRLTNPIDISEFKSFLYITRGATTTGVFGKEFDQLMKLIKSKNTIPKLYENASSTLLPLRKINEENWAEVAFEHRMAFILESQFRSYFVDYMLKDIGDQKKFWKECRCLKPGINASFIDNVILFKGKHLAVEVKLSVEAETDIKKQVRKYCYNTSVNLEGKRFISSEDMHPGKVLIVDTFGLYMYDHGNDSVEKIFSFDTVEMLKDTVAIMSKIEQHL